MALTSVTASSNLREMAWAKDTWMEAQKEMFFQPFIGDDEPTSGKAEATSFNSIIVKKTDLMKSKGDRLQVRLLMQLSGAGVTGDNTLEGNEEALKYFYQNLTIDQLRHAVRIEGRMTEQRTSLAMRTDAKSGLKMWWADQLDSQLLAAILASPTAGADTTVPGYGYWYATDNRILYGGAATSTGTLTVTDICTPTLLAKAKILARMAVPRIRPIKYKGKEYHVVLMHDFNKEDLGRDDDIKSALRDGWWRGEDNPLFSGADFVHKGMICYSYNKIPLTLTGGTGGDVPYSQMLLLGAQAGVLAVGNAGGEDKKGEMNWEEERFDYKNQVGFEAGMIFEAGKSQFNSIDFGAISIYAAYTTLA